MPPKSYDYSLRSGVLPISWEHFHGLCKALAVAVARFQPELILPVGRGGYYPGTLLSHILQAELYPVRLSRRVGDEVVHAHPQWIVAPPDAVAGLRVLIVDEICDTGETLQMIREKTLALGAAAVRSAVLYAHTWAADVPDYIGLLSDALIMNPWDREIWRDGCFQYHPELIQALESQGQSFGPDDLIPAVEVKLAKG